MNHMCLLLIACWSRLDYHYLFRVADSYRQSLTLPPDIPGGSFTDTLFVHSDVGKM